ncbi:MAG: hypothetical protein ACXW1M_06945 [Acidimicrobiia bacterium]
MTAPARSRRRRVRGVTAAVLVVVASLLLPIGLVTIWLRQQVLDTNTFVSTAGKVARDPAVQREVSDTVSSALIRQLDVESNVQRAARSVLPGPSPALAGPLSAGADRAIRTATADVVASSRFEELWEVAVRRAHEHALLLAKGQPVAGVETRNGRIAVNLDPVVDAVVAQLPGAIAALVPPVTTGDDLVLFRSSDLASAQPVVRALDDGWWAVPFLCVVLFAAAVAIAPRRRRAVLWAGGGIVVTSIATFVALLVARHRLLDAVDTDAARAATSATFDVVVDPLRTEVWVTAGIGVALAAAAIVVGLLHHPQPVATPAEEPDTDPTPVPTADVVPGSRGGQVLPGAEPVVASREAMSAPDRSGGQRPEPARESSATTGTTGTPRPSG